MTRYAIQDLNSMSIWNHVDADTIPQALAIEENRQEILFKGRDAHVYTDDDYYQVELHKDSWVNTMAVYEVPNSFNESDYDNIDSIGMNATYWETDNE